VRTISKRIIHVSFVPIDFPDREISFPVRCHVKGRIINGERTRASVSRAPTRLSMRGGGRWDEVGGDGGEIASGRRDLA